MSHKKVQVIPGFWITDVSIENKELFSNIYTSIHFEVKLGNDCKVSVNGKGVIFVYAKNGGRIQIYDVYYALGLKCNLLSIWKLLENKYRVFLKNNVCTLFDKYPSTQLIAKVEITNNMMFLLIMRNGLTDSLNSYKTNNLDQSWL